MKLQSFVKAAANNIPVDATPKAPYSLDANLYHTSYESGVLENPMNGPPKDMFRMTVDPVGHSCTSIASCNKSDEY